MNTPMRFPLCTHQFVLQGLNLERFLALMQKQEIPLLHVERQDARTLVCRCCGSDLPAVIALAQEKGWSILSHRPLGLSAFLQRMKKRPGIPVGMALMLVVMAVLSRCIWRIDIRQAGPYQADIASYLSESGLRPGTLRSSVDAKKLEEQLLLRYPEIAWFQVYARQGTLIVEVTHGVPMPELPPDTQGDVIAETDGIVSSIRVYAGTAAVQSGDVVRKGDLLIRGEERSEDGATVPVRADGVVMARCWQSASVQVPLYDVQSAETGRETIVSCLRTPWFTLGKTAGSPAYLASNLTVTETPVGGAFFPVLLQTRIYREVSMERIPRDAEEVRQEAADAALKKLKSELFPDEIIDKWVDFSMIEDDKLAATVTAERLADIGVFSPP